MDVKTAEAVWRNNVPVRLTGDIRALVYDGFCMTPAQIIAGIIGLPEAANLDDDGNISEFDVAFDLELPNAPYGFKELISIRDLEPATERELYAQYQPDQRKEAE